MPTSYGAEHMNQTITAPTVRPFGKLRDGRDVSLFTLKVPGGWQTTIKNYGAIVTSLCVPQEHGEPVDIVLGFESLDGYLDGHPYFGAICGRVGNRIANGLFSMDDTSYKVAQNNGHNHLHGGVVGFDKQLWKATPRVSEK